MNNAIILHGGPSEKEYYDPDAPSMSNAHWIPWLQGMLLKAGITAATPEVPRSYERIWDVWKREVERFDIHARTILVGHSTGAGFFVKYLSIRKELHVDKVILVAPFTDPFHAHTTDFFRNYTIDPDLAKRTRGITIFHSDNDEDDIAASVKLLRQKIKSVQYKEFRGYGHFCFRDMKTAKFPELREFILAE